MTKDLIDMERKRFSTIDEYIDTFPEGMRKLLQEMRGTIKENAPEASEKISYRMPTFYLNGNLVHFAAFKDHISLFPGSEGVEAFEGELGGYKHSKGTIQFPYGEPLPVDLIGRIVRYRVQQNSNKKRR